MEMSSRTAARFMSGSTTSGGAYLDGQEDCQRRQVRGAYVGQPEVRVFDERTSPVAS